MAVKPKPPAPRPKRPTPQRTKPTRKVVVSAVAVGVAAIAVATTIAIVANDSSHSGPDDVCKDIRDGSMTAMAVLPGEDVSMRAGGTAPDQFPATPSDPLATCTMTVTFDGGSGIDYIAAYPSDTDLLDYRRSLEDHDYFGSNGLESTAFGNVTNRSLVKIVNIGDYTTIHQRPPNS